MAAHYKPTSLSKYNIQFLPRTVPKIFLGGSIEMGSAENWQKMTAKTLAEENCIIFNPRRDGDWDASWEQKPFPGTQFYEQVDWELKAQDASDFIIYNFLPDTKSPITLLELGLFINSNAKKFVVCPESFWRYGNVRIVSELYGSNLQFYTNYDDMMVSLLINLSEWQFLNPPPLTAPATETDNEAPSSLG